MIHDVQTTQKLRATLSRLLHVTVLLSEDMDTALARLGLTRARAQLLWELGGADGITQAELAKRLGVTPRNVTSLIDALEATGFVRRTPHPGDRRAILVRLTEKGEAVAARFETDMDLLADQLFGTLPEAERDALSKGLADLAVRLAALTADASRQGKVAT